MMPVVMMPFMSKIGSFDKLTLVALVVFTGYLLLPLFA